MSVNYTIVVDSREQDKLWDKDVIVKKLDVGDYSILGEEARISIERKCSKTISHTQRMLH